MKSLALPPLVDNFARHIDYLRVSVTDRCDLRCTYCMSERQRFAPKSDVLSFEELERLCQIFIDRGVRRLRVTGGEPLVRRDVMQLMQALSIPLKTGALNELTLTTNGTHLEHFAKQLITLGVRRINVSLDTLDKAKFAQLTRRDVFDKVLGGIKAARLAGLKIKINTVALAGPNGNLDELPDLIAWAHNLGMDVTLIETMPLGETGFDRSAHFVSVSDVARLLSSFWTLEPKVSQSGGPARMFEVRETGGLLGLITPLSHGFCSTCNRVRLTCTGHLHLCLGQEDFIDLRALVRDGASDAEIHKALNHAMTIKPRGHSFEDEMTTPRLRRSMSMTGG
jgi:GTP 3',8-cyclase